MSAWLEHPDWAMEIALACAAIALATWRAAHLARGRRHRLVGADGIAASRGAWSDTLLLIALACLAIGLVGPRIGRARIAPVAGGVDVVLLVDVSQSMDAEDTAPSRLRRALDQARGLLDRLEPGDRVALAGFAARGVLFTPLTPDRDAIAAMLPHLDTRLIRPGGSDLAAGVAASLRAFDETSARPRFVVTWSDGEISRPDGEVGASPALRAHARVIALGIGSEVGAHVPDHGAPLRDASGDPVVSRRFLGPLERLADATGGIVLPADRFGHVPVERIAAALDRGSPSREEASSPEEGEDTRTIATANAPPARGIPVAVAWPFAAIAFALLLAEAGWMARAPIRRGRPRPHARPWLVGAGFAIGLVVGVGPRAGATDGRDPRQALVVRLSRGVERAEAGDAIGAASDFEAVSVLAADPALVALAEYDLGVLDLRGGDLEGARDHFFTALVYAPEDRSARLNAEWTLRAIAASAPPEVEAAAKKAPSTTGSGDAFGSPLEGATPANRLRGDGGQADEGPVDDERSIAEPAGSGPVSSPDAAGHRVPDRPLAPMSSEDRRRWLDRLVDDPSRAMKQRAVDDPGTPRPVRSRITW